MRAGLLALVLALLAAPVWSDDAAVDGSRDEPPAGSSNEAPAAPQEDWELEDWELDIQSCLYTQARCSGTLTIIYNRLQKARQNPEVDEWRVEYWEKRLREYFKYNVDRHD